MDSPYESDASEGMKELVEQGYTIKRDRDYPCPERGYLGETRAQVRDLDASHVRWRLMCHPALLRHTALLRRLKIQSPLPVVTVTYWK